MLCQAEQAKDSSRFFLTKNTHPKLCQEIRNILNEPNNKDFIVDRNGGNINLPFHYNIKTFAYQDFSNFLLHH